jgi:Ulp1 family protease
MNNLKKQVFTPKDIARLASPSTRLNDCCINGCAVLLYHQNIALVANKCALLSTHELVRIRLKASDDILWRNIAGTLYWEKDIWVIPIHRTSPSEHWVLCVLYPREGKLHLFDSLNGEKEWETDIAVFLPLPLKVLPTHATSPGRYEACP